MKGLARKKDNKNDLLDCKYSNYFQRKYYEMWIRIDIKKIPLLAKQNVP